MGASKTKAVGGVPVSQTAQNYTNFLNSALSSGSGAQSAIQSLLAGSNSAGNSSVNDFISQLKNFQPTQIQAPQTNIDLSQGMGSGVQGPDLSQLLAKLQNPITSSGSNVNTNTTSSIDPALQSALTSIINTQQNNDLNQLRESFTANGAGAGAGTPAAYAEAVYKAQAAPQLANAIGQLGLQSRQLNQGDVSNSLSQANLNQTGGLQAAGLNSQNISNALQSLLSQFSTSAQNQTANRGLDINQLGQMLSQAQGNVNNIFNAASLNQQGAQSQQNNLLSLAQLLSGNQNAANQNQLGILAQLFGGLNQANAMGTPQAQVVQTPSGFSQALSGLTSIAGAAAPFFI